MGLLLLTCMASTALSPGAHVVGGPPLPAMSSTAMLMMRSGQASSARRTSPSVAMPRSAPLASATSTHPHLDGNAIRWWVRQQRRWGPRSFGRLRW